MENTQPINTATDLNEELGQAFEAYTEGPRYFFLARYIRMLEEELLSAYDGGFLTGTTHTSIGQELSAVGVISALGREDIVVSNHRCHGHYLAKTLDPKGLLLEIKGDQSGVCRGVGGSQHLCRPGLFYSNGIQGGIVPLATGLAFGVDREQQKKIVTVFVGDGTFGEGVIYESFNFAKVFNLPLLIIVEDNKISQSTITDTVTSSTPKDRLMSFGIETKELNTVAIETIRTATLKCREKLFEGRGPQALVLNVPRLGPHSKGDDTRTQEVLDIASRSDPMIFEASRWSGVILDRINNDIEQLRLNVAKCLRQSTTNDRVIQSIEFPTLTFSDEAISSELDGRSFSERINERLRIILKENPKNIIMGEDLKDPYGGAFKITKGLSTEYPTQVINTAISENAIAGIGAAFSLHYGTAVIEFMFGDFIYLAADQIINHAAKYSHIYGDQLNCRILFRVPVGGRRGYGPTHSQNTEKFFLGIPGLQVLMCSALASTAELYKCAMRYKGPTLLIEDKIDYSQKVKINHGELAGWVHEVRGEILCYKIMHGSNNPSVVIAAYGSNCLEVLKTFNRVEIAREKIEVWLVSKLHPISPIKTIPNKINEITFFILDDQTPSYGFADKFELELRRLGALNVIQFTARDAVVPTSRVLESQYYWSPTRLVEEVSEVITGRKTNFAAEVSQSVNVSSMNELIYVPRLSASDDEVSVLEIHVSQGTFVKKNDLLISLEGSKVVQDIQANKDGFVNLSVNVGDVLRVGEELLYISPSNDGEVAAAGKKKLNLSAIRFTELESKQSSPHFGLRTALRNLERSRDTMVPAYLFCTNSSQVDSSQLTPNISDRIAVILVEISNKNAHIKSYFEGSLKTRPTFTVGHVVDFEEELYLIDLNTEELMDPDAACTKRVEKTLALYRGTGSRLHSKSNEICVVISRLVSDFSEYQIPVLFPNTSMIIGIVSNPKHAKDYITLAYDHRVLNGNQARKILDEIMRML